MSASFFQGDKDYCENTRNTDLMLETFGKDRKLILKTLKENPQNLMENLWSNNSPICKDDDCLFQMGKSLKLSMEDILERKQTVCDSLINYYICPQCRNMRRLIDFTKNKAGEPFMIECGERAGQSLVYEEKKISNLYVKWEKEPLSVKKAYEHPAIIELARCSSASCPMPSKQDGMNELKKYADMSYLATDPFTNNILINWYLQDEITIPNISTMFISWICNGDGYNLYDHLDISNINHFQDFPNFLTNTGKPSPTAKADDKSPIQREIIAGIITQLFAILHNLRKYDFSHGNPSSNSLKFRKESVSYITDGVHVTCPITLKLQDFSSSGCTVLESKVRLYSSSVIAEEQLKKKKFDFIIDSEKTNIETVAVYRLKDPKKYITSSLLFIYMKHLGLPVYSASFDAYSFMIILMCERAFYMTLISDKVLSNFWKNMWINSDDYDKITTRIAEYHEKSAIITINDILKIVAGLSLRCDMIDFGWNLIKSF